MLVYSSHTHTPTHTRTHTPTHTHTHALRTHIHMHTDTHVLLRTHTYSHTHTHTAHTESEQAYNTVPVVRVLVAPWSSPWIPKDRHSLVTIQHVEEVTSDTRDRWKQWAVETTCSIPDYYKDLCWTCQRNSTRTPLVGGREVTLYVINVVWPYEPSSPKTTILHTSVEPLKHLWKLQTTLDVSTGTQPSATRTHLPEELFGVAIPHFLCDEAGNCGKGVVSHYFENHGLGEITCTNSWQANVGAIVLDKTKHHGPVPRCMTERHTSSPLATLQIGAALQEDCTSWTSLRSNYQSLLYTFKQM